MPRTVPRFTWPSLALLIAAVAISPAFAQEEASQPSSEIHVDGGCHILAEGPNQYSAADLHFDDTLCRTESEHVSSHWEQNIDDGVKRFHVTIQEREYLLHNPTAEPVTFVVDQSLPEGWQIDSDPKPAEVANGIATFRVVAQPGQTVRLHIGKRKAVEHQS
jgi:hypothetical protein